MPTRRTELNALHRPPAVLVRSPACPAGHSLYSRETSISHDVTDAAGSRSTPSIGHDNSSVFMTLVQFREEISVVGVSAITTPASRDDPHQCYRHEEHAIGMGAPGG